MLRRAAAFLRQTDVQAQAVFAAAGTFQSTSNVSASLSRISRKAGRTSWASTRA